MPLIGFGAVLALLSISHRIALNPIMAAWFELGAIIMAGIGVIAETTRWKR